MLVLGTPSVHTDGEMFPGNAVNRPLYVVNTGRDPLYPAHAVEPYVDHLRKLGASVVFRVYPETGHIQPGGGRTSGRSSRRSCRTIRASRCPTGFRGRPSASIGSIARIGSSSTGWGRSRARAGWPTATCCTADASSTSASGLTRRSIAAAARRRSWRGRMHFEIGLRTGDRFVEVNGKAVETGLEMVQLMERWVQGDRVRLVVERGGERTDARRCVLARRGRAAADADFSAAQAVGPRRSRAAWECSGGIDRRRESIYVAAVAVDLRLPAPDHGCRERPHGLRRHGRAERGRRC